MIRARLGLGILLALAALQVFGLEPLPAARAAESLEPARASGRSPSVHELAVVAMAGCSAALYFQRARGREMRERRRTALAEDQLDALRFQLRPHFLFNTLHTLLPLVEKDPDRARSMVVRLGELLRLSLRAEERPLVTLGEEVAILESYLSIEQVRFRDRIDVSIRVEPEAAEAAVPSFLLQPLVENALERGGPGAGSRSRIAITAHVEGSELVITVGNDGERFGTPSASSETSGLGRRHTQRRLEALYPGSHRLELLATPGGGAEVRLRIPLSFIRLAALAV